MRLILYTGKGGVGKTSLAAASAVAIAAKGKKTLLVSSDMANNLADIFQRQPQYGYAEVAPNLTTQVVANRDPASRWRKSGRCVFQRCDKEIVVFRFSGPQQVKITLRAVHNGTWHRSRGVVRRRERL